MTPASATHIESGIRAPAPAARLRILVTTPYCWPFVRRGTEHGVYDMTCYLTRQGHEVTTLSSVDGHGFTKTDETGRQLVQSSPWRPFLGQIRIQPTHLFFIPSFRAALRSDADIVHSFYFYDSLAVSYAQRGRKFRTVLHMNGAPIPGAYYRRFPPERWAIRQAIARADCRLVCSEFIRQLILEHYGQDCRVLRPGTVADLSGYPLGAGPPDGRPTLLAAADFNVRRKGVRVLLAAFAIVKPQVPDLRLRISGPLADDLRRELLLGLPPDVRDAVDFLGLGNPGDLARELGQADLTILPSMWEPSGYVLVESWACGTPVVATNHGGLPEFVRPEVGILFDPLTSAEETSNREGLAHAILEGLELSRQPGIRARCRAHAEQFSSLATGTQLERLYCDLIAGRTVSA